MVNHTQMEEIAMTPTVPTGSRAGRAERLAWRAALTVLVLALAFMVTLWD
ncbi:hypothetical protein GCM10009802_13440 [Streptomyces synnematoformans]|uniref:Uncharacterized protein n=1 Tax=Streptomyces synnematoformans TaxID=415721 RepID=A0ABN2XNU0_9ACTN